MGTFVIVGSNTVRINDNNYRFSIKSIEGVFMDQTISTVSSIAGDARKLYSVTSLFSLFVSLLICLHYIYSLLALFCPSVKVHITAAHYSLVNTNLHILGFGNFFAQMSHEWQTVMIPLV